MGVEKAVVGMLTLFLAVVLFAAAFRGKFGSLLAVFLIPQQVH